MLKNELFLAGIGFEENFFEGETADETIFFDFSGNEVTLDETE